MKYYCVVIFFLLIDFSYAFDNKQSHPDITRLSIDNSQVGVFLEQNLSFAEGEKHQIKVGNETLPISEWIAKGSKEEDEPACRASNHFLNPLLPWDQAELTDGLWVVDVWCNVTSPFRKKYSNLVWATGMSTPNTPMPDPPNSNLKYLLSAG